jgi:hypothetical protein
MKNVHDPYDAARAKLGRENPESWVWDEDGVELAGHFRGPDTGTMKDGTEVPLRIIETKDGRYRSLWLFESPQDLRRVFDDLDRDGLEEGDYVIVRRLPKRQFTDEKSGERRYFVPFAGTRISAAELVEPEDEATDEATETDLASEREERDTAASGLLNAPLGGTESAA